MGSDGPVPRIRGAIMGETGYNDSSYFGAGSNRCPRPVETRTGSSMPGAGNREKLPVARAVLLLLLEKGGQGLGEILAGLEGLRERGLVESYTRDEVERVLAAWQALGVLRNGDGRYTLTEQAKKHWYTKKLKEIAKTII